MNIPISKEWLGTVNSLALSVFFVAQLFQAVGVSIGGVVMPPAAAVVPALVVIWGVTLLFRGAAYRPSRYEIYLVIAFWLLSCSVVMHALNITTPPSASFAFHRQENISSQTLYLLTFTAAVSIVCISHFNYEVVRKGFHLSAFILIFLFIDEVIYRQAGVGLYPSLHQGDFRIQHTGQLSYGISRFTGPFYEPSIFGGMSASYFGYFAAMTLKSRKAFYAVMGVIFFLLAVRTMSTTGFLGLFLASLLIFYLTVRAANRARATSAIMVLFFGVALFGVYTLGASFDLLDGKQYSRSFVDRVGLDISALSYLMEQPLGVAYGSARVSSLVINILINGGLVFGLIFWIIIAIVCWKSVQQKKPLSLFLPLVIVTHSPSIPDLGHPQILVAALCFLIGNRLRYET